ncbi:transglycosylase SLT domain-containing protein [Herbaspirillum sp. RTI4]|uniref:transglycosylase SLT domain-containing protein n=1 Tax=Herbaspirillum sp. RTI4 TaxID=3048640 RepID=UPI002AB54742|nr:transglycosylase SLT domain-containing protein [Herbaspirillum sp. RTI4]MDY7579616.1 transglycosylase SLT domain-containing protein [Herbaspirillum sp. RTI4]MEA9983558.1 transglycosylase SLT domain-containing protein [Herbaspirillum sp. RTI4]
MQSTLKKLSLSALLSLSIPLFAQANDISIYPVSFNSFNPNDPAALAGMEDTDVWVRIRKGFGIPDLENPLVVNQTQWYSSRPDYIQRTTTRASRYLYHVVQELEKRGMPTELALLPFIESAFNPQAYSSAKAAGMWQFIPSTGLDFNLKQNMFKDERRDVLASTDAALTYLQKLYGMFGDWQLALAAYNWGEGSVQRAVNRNIAAGLPTDFNTLSAQMPAETRNYVPKLQAVKNIIANPGEYGLTLPKVDNQPYFVTIGKMRDIDVKVAAQLAELSIDEFQALNPQFNRPVIIGSEDTKILLPQSNAEKFKENIAKWTHKLSSWTSHKVMSARERIETIASKFGTTPEIIRSVNHIPPKMVLTAGSTILVPKTEAGGESDISAEVADNARLAVAPDVPDTRRIFVKTSKRDSLSSIAKRYNVSVSEIKQWNELRRDTLVAGQSLRLQVPYNSRLASTKTAHSAPPRQIAHAKATPSRTKVAASGKQTRTAQQQNKKRPSMTLASGKGSHHQ